MHPDKRGNGADQTRLTAARDAWNNAVKDAAGKHGGKKAAQVPEQGLVPASWQERKKEAGFRVQSERVLLTYMKFADLAVWPRFLVFVDTLLQTHGVKHWCATLETSADKTDHLHLMLQFHKLKGEALQTFLSRGCAPTLAQTTCLGKVLPKTGLTTWPWAFRS